MINFALFGAGRIGGVHAANIAANSRGSLVSVYDSNEAAAQRLASEYGAKVVGSIESALNDDDVHAVLIASSTNTHLDLMIASAQAGKAVFCEKPIDLDISRIDQQRRLIAATGVPVQIGFNRRYDRSHRAVQQAVQKGEIGAVELLVITSRDPGLAPLSYLRVSGGIFRDMTIHDFDMARYILGPDPIEEIYATGSIMVDPSIRDVDDLDTAMIVMKAASGALVHINNSRRSVYGYDQRIEAFGGAGMVKSDNQRPNTLVRYGEQATDAKEPLLNFFLERYNQSYVDELNDFIDAVAEGKKPSVDFEDGRAALVLADGAWESVRSGKPVRIRFE